MSDFSRINICFTTDPPEIHFINPTAKRQPFDSLEMYDLLILITSPSSSEMLRFFKPAKCGLFDVFG